MKRKTQYILILVFAALILSYSILHYSSVSIFKKSIHIPSAAAVAIPMPNEIASSKAIDLPVIAAAKPLQALDDKKCVAFINALMENKKTRTFQAQLELANEEANFKIESMLVRAKSHQDAVTAATARYLHGQMQAHGAIEKYARQHPECESDDVCLEQKTEIGDAARYNGVNELAKQAIYSPDPRVYAMAFHACSQITDKQNGFCQQISASQWAQRDPDNGVAWLFLLSQSAKNSPDPLSKSKIGKQDGEFENAIFRLSQSKKFDWGLSPLSTFQQSQLIQNENPLIQSNLGRLAGELSIYMSLPCYGILTNYCQLDRLVDANRRQICDGVASRLINADDSMFSRLIGLKLGERLAWAPEKMVRLREETDALREMQRIIDDSLQRTAKEDKSKAEQACRSMVMVTVMEMEIDMDYLDKAMRHGEVGALQLRMKKQKFSQAELAESFRKSIQKANAEMALKKSASH